MVCIVDDNPDMEYDDTSEMEYKDSSDMEYNDDSDMEYDGNSVMEYDYSDMEYYGNSDMEYDQCWIEHCDVYHVWRGQMGGSPALSPWWEHARTHTAERAIELSRVNLAKLMSFDEFLDLTAEMWSVVCDVFAL